MIAERVQRGLEEARETYWYLPGNFARTLLQTQLTENRRWQKEKKPYKLMKPSGRRGTHSLLRPHLVRQGRPHLGNPHHHQRRLRTPTGRRLHRPGKPALPTGPLSKRARTKSKPYLESEGYGIAELESEFLGFVPIPEDAPDRVPLPVPNRRIQKRHQARSVESNSPNAGRSNRNGSRASTL